MEKEDKEIDEFLNSMSFSDKKNLSNAMDSFISMLAMTGLKEFNVLKTNKNITNNLYALCRNITKFEDNKKRDDYINNLDNFLSDIDNLIKDFIKENIKDEN